MAELSRQSVATVPSLMDRLPCFPRGVCCGGEKGPKMAPSLCCGLCFDIQICPCLCDFSFDDGSCE